MFNLLRWFRERRWKHLLTGLAFVFATFTSGKVKAEYSPTTVKAVTESRAYFKQIKNHKSWSEIEQETMAKKIVAIIHSLADDVLSDLKKGNHKDALEEFKTLLSFSKMADKLGVFAEVANDLIKVNAAIDQITKKKEKGVKKSKIGSLPSGRYIFKSEHFFLDLRIESEKGKLLVSYNKTGIPLKEGEWEIASKGKPEAIKKYVLKTILKSKSSSDYLR